VPHIQPESREAIPPNRSVVSERQTMTPSEAFIETLAEQGVTDVFGIRLTGVQSSRRGGGPGRRRS
jgi:hypothetical protein